MLVISGEKRLNLSTLFDLEITFQIKVIPKTNIMANIMKIENVIIFLFLFLLNSFAYLIYFTASEVFYLALNI